MTSITRFRLLKHPVYTIPYISQPNSNVENVIFVIYYQSNLTQKLTLADEQINVTLITVLNNK